MTAELRSPSGNPTTYALNNSFPLSERSKVIKYKKTHVDKSNLETPLS